MLQLSVHLNIDKNPVPVDPSNIFGSACAIKLIIVKATLVYKFIFPLQFKIKST